MTEPETIISNNSKYVLWGESDFLDDIITTLTSISSSLHGLFNDFATYPAFVCLDSDLIRLQRETETLCKNTEFLISSQLHGAHQAMADLHSELTALHHKYENLRNDWNSQQENVGQMQAELFRVRSLVQQQSQFCASLGAVMGNLIWKASRLPPVVDMLLSGNKVADFLAIVNGSLISFMETYESSMPSQCADESQFILSMCGIVTNIAATPAGRQFLVTNSNGRELIEQFDRILPVIPAPSGNCLKRLLLMALYNTSINHNGLKFLQQQTDLLSALTHDFQTDVTTYELKLMELRLLQSLTYDIPNGTILKDILKHVPLEIIQAMTKCSQPEMRNVIQEILNNIKKAQHKYEAKCCHSDLWQSGAKCPRGCGEDPPPFGGKVAGGRESSNAYPVSGCYNNSYMKHPV